MYMYVPSSLVCRGLVPDVIPSFYSREDNQRIILGMEEALAEYFFYYYIHVV